MMSRLHKSPEDRFNNVVAPILCKEYGFDSIHVELSASGVGEINAQGIYRHTEHYLFKKSETTSYNLDYECPKIKIKVKNKDYFFYSPVIFKTERRSCAYSTTSYKVPDDNAILNELCKILTRLKYYIDSGKENKIDELEENYIKRSI